MTRRTFFIAAVLAGALFVSACGDDDAATTTTAAPATTAATATTAAPATTAATIAPTGFPADFVDSYMDGCTSEATTEACQCTIDQFEERYTLDEFIEIATSSDENDPRVEEVINFCLTNG
jgi:hypothetical protein